MDWQARGLPHRTNRREACPYCATILLCPMRGDFGSREECPGSDFVRSAHFTLDNTANLLYTIYRQIDVGQEV